MEKLSRKDFIKNSGFIALSLAGLSTISGCDNNSEKSITFDQLKDYEVAIIDKGNEYECIIVGFGLGTRNKHYYKLEFMDDFSMLEGNYLLDKSYKYEERDEARSDLINSLNLFDISPAIDFAEEYIGIKDSYTGKELYNMLLDINVYMNEIYSYEYKK